MKKLVFVFTLFPILLVSCQTYNVVKRNNLKSLIIRTLNNWDSTISNCTTGYNECKSWLKEGVRRPYFCIKPEFNTEILEKYTGMPVFIKGPHANGINLTSQKSFGHYNPEFLIVLDVLESELLNDERFNFIMMRLYENHFKNICRIYYLAYKYLNENPEKTVVITQKYKEIVAIQVKCDDGFLCPPSELLQESYRNFAETMESNGYNIYESFTAPGFWIRRRLDGTDTRFLVMLEKVLLQYDNDFIKDKR